MLERHPAVAVVSDSLSFQQAFEHLLARAPGPVFPRARSLYLRKYPLEGEAAGPFLTFLLEEEIQESAAGALRIRSVAFALVAWQQPSIDIQLAADYLQSRWGLQPADLHAVEGQSWFRDGGGFARFQAAAVYERTAPTSLLSSPVDSGAPAADPGSGP
jgi:hypothetical protein